MAVSQSASDKDETRQSAPFAASHSLAALLTLGRPLVMGILNVTPDSFSDGGQFFDPAHAITHAGEMAEQGADILDIGAESTRPYGNARPVSAEDELARLKPVLPAVAKLGLPLSIDTVKAKVAEWALDYGASIVNDVWGLQYDPGMAALVAKRGVPVVAMHNRETVDESIDIVADVIDFFARTLEIASQAGIPREMIVLDPGIGFGKTATQGYELVRRLGELKTALGLPVLLGVSRKRLIGAATGRGVPADRMAGSLAAGVYGAMHGADIVRVHDVAAHVDAFKVLAAIEGRTIGNAR